MMPNKELMLMRSDVAIGMVLSDGNVNAMMAIMIFVYQWVVSVPIIFLLARASVLSCKASA
jgi:hypothetical protein